MPPPIEKQRRPEQSKETPSSRTERAVSQIENKIDYYRQNIVPDRQSLDIDGYDRSTWNVDRVLKFENYLFIASRDGRIAGFQIVSRDQNGDQLAKLDMTKFPQIVSVLKEKFGIAPTPPVQRAEQARRNEEQRRPEARLDGTPESVLAVLQQISVESGGQKLSVAWPSATALSRHLRTNGVPVSRYSQYVANIRDHASLLSSALRSSSFRGTVTFDGQHFRATDGQRTLMTTATRVLVQGRGGAFTTLNGERVTVDEKATTTQYTIGSRIEIHRRDGGIQMSKEGSLIRYYDGSNSRSLIERNGNDVRINGPYGSVGMRPRGDVRAYAREIAVNLRTPEAIGAFISQFYYGQDFKTLPQNAEWIGSIQQPGNNPIQYIGDGSHETVQDWSTTLARGAGDCEDFALLAQELLRQVGITSITMMVDPTHYETVYFEKAPGGGYYVCTVGLKGFSRSKESFATRGQAVETLWNGSGNGAQFALKNPEVREKFTNPDDPDAYPLNAPGIFALLQPGQQSGTSTMIQYSEEASLATYMREEEKKTR